MHGRVPWTCIPRSYKTECMFRINRNLIGGAFLLLAGFSLLPGCVADDRTDCRFPLRLEFRQLGDGEFPVSSGSGEDVPASRASLPGEEMEVLTLYLFERESGALAASIVPESDAVTGKGAYSWPVPPGNYQLVAWGGTSGGHSVSSEKNLEEALLSASALSEGDTPKPAHLFYGAVGEVTITGDYTDSYTLELQRKSKLLHLTVTGLGEAERSLFYCSLKAPGSYDFTGTSVKEAAAVECPLLEISHERDVIRESYLPGLYEGDDSYIRIGISGDGNLVPDHVIYEGSLSGLLLRNPSTVLETESEYRITLNYYGRATDGSVHFDLYVNDWQVIHQNSDLE